MPQTMTLLSGGEQALTAMSLIFAVFLTNPAPICVPNEVLPLLDDAHVERFCNLLDSMRQRTNTRFMVIKRAGGSPAVGTGSHYMPPEDSAYASMCRLCFTAHHPTSRKLSAVCKSTETSWLTPRSAMVTPNRRSMRLMVIGLWVITMKRVLVR
jgi:hypothetical protein